MEYLQTTQSYSTEIGFVREIIINEELLPSDGNILTMEIMVENDAHVQTNAGCRILKAGTICKFTNDDYKITSLKVLNGTGKIYINAGTDMVLKEAILYSKTMNKM